MIMLYIIYDKVEFFFESLADTLAAEEFFKTKKLDYS